MKAYIADNKRLQVFMNAYCRLKTDIYLTVNDLKQIQTTAIKDICCINAIYLLVMAKLK